MSDNVTDFPGRADQLRKMLAERLANERPPPHPPDMTGERLARLEGAFDWAKVALAAWITVTVAGFALLGILAGITNARLDRLEGKLDTIPQRLTEEFGRMRAEMSAQTSAISSAVTAVRSGPPQVILMPAPQLPAPTIPDQPK